MKVWLALSVLRSKSSDVSFYFFLNDKYFVMLFSFLKNVGFFNGVSDVKPVRAEQRTNKLNPNIDSVEYRMEPGTYRSVECEHSFFSALTVLSRFHIHCIIVDGNTRYQVSFI